MFETVIVLMLSARLPANQIFGALLGYRALYYWLPLITAALLLGLQEILRKRERLGAFVRLFERWVSPMVPQVFAFDFDCDLADAPAFLSQGIFVQPAV